MNVSEMKNSLFKPRDGKRPGIREILNTELFSLATRYNARCFVETGTHYAYTLMAMWETNYFEKILSVELSEDIFRFVGKKIASNYGSTESTTDVNIWLGDCVEILPEMLKKVDSRAIFWLDAHCSEGDTARVEEYDSTILHELKIISQHTIKDHVIAIDDINSCYNQISDYPTIEEIKDALMDINDRYMVTIKYGVLFAEVPASLEENYADGYQ